MVELYCVLFILSILFKNANAVPLQAGPVAFVQVVAKNLFLKYIEIYSRIGTENASAAQSP